MGDLINGRTPEEIKTAVINCDEHCSCADCPEDERGYCDQSVIIKYARRLIEHIESERDAALAKVPRWIGVEDKLPEKECKVLVYIGACNITQGWYLGDGVFEVGIGAKFNVKSAFDRIVLPCWMPMPEPPKEGTT